MTRSAAVLGLAAESCGVTIKAPLTEGGSGAVSALCHDGQGRPVVLKCLAADAEAVDGHDLATFRAKQEQVRLLTRLAPGIARRYPTLLNALHEADWTAYVFEYVDRPSLVSFARRDGPAAAQRILREVWSHLLADGYRHGIEPAGRNHWDTVYLDRLPRRRRRLAEQVPEELLDAQWVRVNGNRVAGLDRLVERARTAAPWFAAAQTAVPAHGDLNLRNLLVPARGGDFTLIDPRGVTTAWDPVYDLAKMLFSLSLFETAMNSGFTVDRRAPGDYRVAPAAPNEHQRWLMAFLADAPHFARLAEDAGLAVAGWRERLLLAHASHVLAEAACRLSDRAAPPAIRRNRCLGLLLFGMVLLSDLLDRLDADDAGAHPAFLQWVFSDRSAAEDTHATSTAAPEQSHNPAKFSPITGVC